MGKLIIDGNSVYELDEECLKQKEEKERNQQKTEQKGSMEEDVSVINHKKGLP